MNALPLTIDVASNQTVSGLLQVPEQASACYVLAHGAGAGMTHPFMVAVADGLSNRGVATLRYQFPFMERSRGGLTRPNWRMPRCVLPLPRRANWHPHCRCSPAAGRSVRA
jgi:hypothetical protein